MCLFGGSTPKAVTPAPAPSPPTPPPTEQPIGAARKAEEDSIFGPGGPTYRERATVGALRPGGSGVRM